MKHGYYYLLFICLCCIVVQAQAANIVIVNNDGSGEGLNDSSAPILPAPGNTGATLGQQRMMVLQAAARQWGALLKSNVTIRFKVTFDDLQCDSNYVSFAGTGASWWQSTGSSPPSGLLADTAYPLALYESRTGQHVVVAGLDSTLYGAFNKKVDTGCFPGTSHYWYGLDRSVPAPADTRDLLRIAMHEMGHGLGFLTLECRNPNGCGGPPYGGYAFGVADMWARFVYDYSYQLFWDQMNDAQRGDSMKNDPWVVWAGSNTVDALTAIPQYSLTTGFLTDVDGNRYMRLSAPPGSGDADTQHWTPDNTDKSFLMGGSGSIIPNDPVDITYTVFQDMGWGTNPRDTLFTDNFDTIQ